MYQSKPCLTYFSAVVKNVANPSIEIKKLVYIYILHYAELEPDLALLSINTIQKSLSDQNPQVRAMALRVMSGIRVPVISQIVSLAIKKGCADMSPHVRKAAALAIPKCYSLDPGTLPQLLDYLSTLLGDKQYYVVGAAVTAFLEVCPERIDLIHKHYRGLVKKLVDMDEWGQLAVVKLMNYYARKCFPRQHTSQKKRKSNSQTFYNDKAGKEAKSSAEFTESLDPDLELFLRTCKQILSSRNSAVVVAIARCFLTLGTAEYLDSVVAPLIGLLRSPQAFHQIVLYNIVAVCLERPKAFLPYFGHFLVRASDSSEVLRLKLEVMTLLFPHGDDTMKGLVMNELEHFTKADNPELVRESVRAIGRCAHNDPQTSRGCMNLLLKQASSPDGNLVAEALTVVRHLIQQDPTSHAKTVIRLAKNLDTMTNSDARASIIWLVGEFAATREEENIAPDVLRILLQGFADEAEPAKLQIMLLAAKVYLNYLNQDQPSSDKGKGKGKEPALDQLPDEDGGFAEPSPQTPKHPIPILWRYALLLARYDVSYDLRDRARLYKALLENPVSTQLANLMLFASKPAPHAPSPSEGRRGFLLGSASLVIGTEAGLSGLRGYEPLPDWVKPGDEPDKALRDELDPRSEYRDPTSRPAGELLDQALRKKEGEATASGAGLNKNKTLDDWLAEDEGEEDEEEGEDDSSGEEETESEEGTDSGEEEEESDDDDDEHEAGPLTAQTGPSQA